MIQPALRLRGILNEPNGRVRDVVATLFEPVRNEGQNDWSCIIQCPDIREGTIQVAGVDATQALELAEALVRELLTHKGARIVERSTDSDAPNP